MTPATLAQIHASAFAPARGWSADEFAGLLAQSGAILLGDARAFVLGRVTLDEAEILTIATLLANRRQGLAQHMLHDFETKAQQAGAKSCFLEVAENNAPAKALYAKAGYAQVGCRREYYTAQSGPAIDALILRKSLCTD